MANKEFKDALAVNFLAKVRELRQEGVTAMSFDNLVMLVPVPRITPSGAASPAAFREVCAQVCSENKEIARFLLEEEAS